jgi:hypothetical protein
MVAARDAFLADADRADVDVLSADGYGTFSARRVRYRFLEAVYSQNAFKADVTIPTRFEPEVGREAYTFIRDVLGIGYGLGEFHATHLMGGSLDPAAGDGRTVPSALPILMPAGLDGATEAAVRAALASLFKHSNWGTKKDLVSHLGATLGDCFVEAADDFRSDRDFARNRVRLNVVHPSRVRSLVKDPEDNVQEYEYEYAAQDDVDPRRTVTYNERCWKDDRTGLVWYRTYKERKAYAWPGNPEAGKAEWSVPYTFIPLVHVQHKDVGLGWGQAEVEPALVGWRELADLCSCMTDWARRALHSPHLIAGSGGPTTTTVLTEVNTDGRTRDKSPFFYVTNPQAHSDSLLSPLPVGELTEYLRELRQKQREDYPEIALQVLQTTGTPSGESIRRAREPAAAKVRKRRESYNGPSERIFKMALSMMAVREYPQAHGLDAGAYGRDELQFKIGPTPVFGLDPIEAMEEKRAKFEAMKMAVDGGQPLEFVMAEFGYNEDEIARMTGARDRAAVAQLAAMRAAQAQALSDLGGPDGDEAGVGVEQ